MCEFWMNFGCNCSQFCCILLLQKHMALWGFDKQHIRACLELFSHLLFGEHDSPILSRSSGMGSQWLSECNKVKSNLFSMPFFGCGSHFWQKMKKKEKKSGSHQNILFGYNKTLMSSTSSDSFFSLFSLRRQKLYSTAYKKHINIDNSKLMIKIKIW